MDKIIELVDGQLDTDISNLAVMEPGSEEKAKEVANITELLKARTEAKTQSWDKILKIASIGVTLGTFAIAMAFKKSEMSNMWKFEEKGTLTSDAGREIRRFDLLKFVK